MLVQPVLWQTLWTSLRIVPTVGVSCAVPAMMPLWSSRELRAWQKMLVGRALEMSGMLAPVMLGIVLTIGSFLLSNDIIDSPRSTDGTVIFTSALMATPYVLKVPEDSMCDIVTRYSILCWSLGVEGWLCLEVVELRTLKCSLAQALVSACVLSVSDFGTVALFSNDGFRILPFYLYQQIDFYRSQDGMVTALVLLLLCSLLFTVVEGVPGRNVKTD